MLLEKINDFGEYKIRMPSINCDFSGYSFLSKLQEEICNNKKISSLVVVFPHNCFIEANLFSVLGAILPSPVKVNFDFHKGLFNSARMRGVLERNGFLNYYGSEYQHNCSDTTIQYKIFKRYDLENFAQYIATDIFKIGAFPKMSSAAQKRMIECILEIFSNSIDHGQTEKIFICGQYYPNKGFLKFTLVDLGITIKTNIFQCMKLDFTGVAAIKWAISDNNTTRQGNTPGGLGLKILRNFLKKNGGSIQIISNDGFWEESSKGEDSKALEVPFKGTVVTVSFNTNDSKQYVTSSEQA